MFTDEARLGCRSPLVLQKLGHDLRSCLDDTLRSPLSGDLKTLSDQLLGYAEWTDAAEQERLPDADRTLF